MVQNPQNLQVVENVIRALVAAAPKIENQKWNFVEESGGRSIDFDSIYQLYFNQSRIPALFEEMIQKLQHIVDSQQVDSVRALHDLERLIATLKKNIKGSFFSTLYTKEFAQAFIFNSLVSLGTSIPLVGNLIEGLIKTIDDMNIEFTTVSEKIKNDIKSKTTLDLPALKATDISRPSLPGH